MAEILIEVAVRLLNTGIGALLGYGLGTLRHMRVIKIFGLDREMSLLAWTVAGALVGLLWGKKLWAKLDRNIDSGRL